MESVEVTYERSSQTIICVSRGGPATSVTWYLDGFPILVDGNTYRISQIVTDTSTATYRNQLTIVAKSAALSGNYTCSVGNTRGKAAASLVISGMNSSSHTEVKGLG